MELPNQDKFFEKYNIKKNKWTSTKLKWKDLEEIFEHHISCTSRHQDFALFVVNQLTNVPSVHSTRHRIKNPEHLIEKIIRKSIDDKRRKININNYQKQIKDIVGIRILHLFKKDWTNIHHAICEKFDLAEKPVAYIRKGDSEEIADLYKLHNCDVENHKYGYRSIHYVIETKPTKIIQYAEIQIRTVFEEGWSEIDHKLRYPYDVTNPILVKYLAILNSLCGSADEMSTFIKTFHYEWNEMEKNNHEQKEIINDLENQINELKINKKQKEKLIQKLNNARDSNNASTTAMGSLSTLNYDDALGIYTTPKCRRCGAIIPLSIAGDDVCQNCKWLEISDVSSGSLAFMPADNTGIYAGVLCNICGKPKKGPLDMYTFDETKCSCAF